jgi:putative ABC transport system substrate-binding protein
MFQNRIGNQRIMLIGVVVVSLLLCACASSQPKPKIYKVGIYTEGSERAEIVEGFKEGMAELGYVEGQNVVYVQSDTWSGGSGEGDPGVEGGTESVEPGEGGSGVEGGLQELVDEQVDVILTGDMVSTTFAVQASQEAGIPIVFTYGQGVLAWEVEIPPLESTSNQTITLKLVESYTQPGGRVTGITSGIDESVGKRMEFLKRMAPDIEIVLWGYMPGMGGPASVEDHRKAAAALGLELVERPVGGFTQTELGAGEGAPAGEELPPSEGLLVAEFGAVFEAIQPDEVDAIFVDMAMAALSNEAIVALAERDGLPTIYPYPFPGALAVYGTNGYQSGVQAASLVDKILRGQDPGSLPVEFPKKIELVIDLGVAENIGLTIPEEVLRMADKVIPAEGGG